MHTYACFTQVCAVYTLAYRYEMAEDVPPMKLYYSRLFSYCNRPCATLWTGT